VFEDRLPGDSAVFGFEDAAARRAHVINVGVAGNSHHRGHATAAARRAQVTESQVLEDILLVRVRLLRGRLPHHDLAGHTENRSQS
jgi:hypothetical protein